MKPNYENIKAAIDAAGNRIFSVVFIKRSTGEERKMVCRRHVTAHLQGGQQPYKPKDYKLITVFDTSVQDYRNISVDGIKQITIDKVTYEFEPRESVIKTAAKAKKVTKQIKKTNGQDSNY